MGEVLSLAKKSGVDPLKVVDTFTQTVFPLYVYQHSGKQIALNPHYFAGYWIAVKDLGLFEETASQKESQAPLAHLVHSLLSNTDVSHGENDTRIP